MDMDGDLGSLLSSVMSDPEQMAKLSAMAQSLLGGTDAGAPSPEPPAPAVQPAPVSSGLDGGLTAALGKALGSLSGRGGSSRSAALLGAMRPYMRPEKQEKLDRALQIARMVHVASAVLGTPPGMPEPPRRDRRPSRPPFLDLGSLFQKTEAAGWETDDLLLALVLYLMYRESGDTDLLILLAVMLLT